MPETKFKWNYYDNSNLFSLHPESIILVHMDPGDFLGLAAPSHLGEENIEHLKAAIEKGDELPLPFLTVVQRGGKCIVSSHEGRHRAEAARRLGLKDFPVLIFFEEPNPNWPVSGMYKYLPLEREKQMCCACQPDMLECSCDMTQEGWMEWSPPDEKGGFGAEIHGMVDRRVTIRPQEIDWKAVPDIAHATARWRREHGFDF